MALSLIQILLGYQNKCSYIGIYPFRFFCILLSFIGCCWVTGWLAKPWPLRDLLSFHGASLTSRGQKRAKASLRSGCVLHTRKPGSQAFYCLGAGLWAVANLITWTGLKSPQLFLGQRQHHGTPWWHQVAITAGIHQVKTFLPLKSLPTRKGRLAKKAVRAGGGVSGSSGKSWTSLRSWVQTPLRSGFKFWSCHFSISKAVSLNSKIRLIVFED